MIAISTAIDRAISWAYTRRIWGGGPDMSNGKGGRPGWKASAVKVLHSTSPGMTMRQIAAALDVKYDYVRWVCSLHQLPVPREKRGPKPKAAAQPQPAQEE